MIPVTAQSQSPVEPGRALSRLLLCAPTRWEAGPLVRRWGLSPSSDRRYEGRVGGRPVTLLRCGMGPAAAAESLDRETGEPGYAFAVSVGFVGALQEGMACGDVVADLRGADLELAQLARRVAGDLGLKVHFGRIAHSDRVLSSPEEKAAWGDKERAAAVDMETAAVAAWAARRGLPCLPVRVVLDRRQDRLPQGQPQGEDVVSLLSYALRNRADLPLLLRTGLRARRAMTALGGFLDEFLPQL